MVRLFGSSSRQQIDSSVVEDDEGVGHFLVHLQQPPSALPAN
jgi:hypothetical protein